MNLFLGLYLEHNTLGGTPTGFFHRMGGRTKKNAHTNKANCMRHSVPFVFQQKPFACSWGGTVWSQAVGRGKACVSMMRARGTVRTISFAGDTYRHKKGRPVGQPFHSAILCLQQRTAQ